MVYLIRTKKTDGWFYEFKPLASGEFDATGMNVKINVYSEKLPEAEIDSLRRKSTYYVIDPGMSNDSCNPKSTFLPKVIIVSSPNEQHWGGKEFAKLRGSVMGVFKYFPLWSLDELMRARLILGPAFSEEKIELRFCQVGGVPQMMTIRRQTTLPISAARNTSVRSGMKWLEPGTVIECWGVKACRLVGWRNGVDVIVSSLDIPVPQVP